MRTVLVRLGALAATTAVLATLAACGGGTGAAPDGAPRIVVTTSILGDVVAHLVGDDAEVEVIMPPGSDPHDFAPSPRQAAAMRDAEVLVANGLGFEVGLADTIEAAEADGVTVISAADAVQTLPLPGAGEDGPVDPHFFTDPVRMADAASAIADELAAQVDGLDTPAFRDRVTTYLAELADLDAEVTATLAVVPAEHRLMVTNHEVFGYFADRYDFEVLGAVIPGGTTLAEPSAGDLRELADAIAARGLPAIFAEASAPARLAEALAAEGADVEVVELYTESLGEPGTDGDTYVGMVRANAERIAAALG